MRLKDDSVEVPAALGVMYALLVCNEVYEQLNTDLVVTSWSERATRHSLSSLHYRGDAFDIRTRNLPSHIDRQQVAEAIRRRLNADYDVVVEDTHIHVEYQPKLRAVQ